MNKNEELTNIPDKCECQLHMLVLTDAEYRNKLDESYTIGTATLTCLACGKEHRFYTCWGLGPTYYEKDGVRIEGKIPKVVGAP